MKTFAGAVQAWILVFFVGSWAAAASPDFACYESIVGYTAGPYNLDLTSTINTKSVLFPGTLVATNPSTNQGLFILFENSACFFHFATEPVRGQDAYYPMKIRVPGITPFYLGFQIVANGNPTTTWSPAPLPGLIYADSPCATVADASGEKAIADFLGGKIRTVADRYSLDLTSCSSFRNCKPKKEYIAALNSCPVESLKATIDEAITSLQDLPECGCPTP